MAGITISISEAITDTLECYDKVKKLKEDLSKRCAFTKDIALLVSCEILLCELEEFLRGNETPHTRQKERDKGLGNKEKKTVYQPGRSGGF